MKILLAVDGSEASITAISVVRSLSLPPDSTVELLTVIPDSPWSVRAVAGRGHDPAAR